MSVAAVDARAMAAAPTLARYRLRTEGSEAIPLHVDRWFGEPEPVEEGVLARAASPVLDVGCGPARHAIALARCRVVALGVDVAPSAVRIAEARGAPVLADRCSIRCRARARGERCCSSTGTSGSAETRRPCSLGSARFSARADGPLWSCTRLA